MKKRIDRICAIYMAIIVCLAGFLVFVVYQQEQTIKEQSEHITRLNGKLVVSAQGAQAYEDYLEAYGHSLWHFNEQARWLYAENQRMHNELISSELYEVEHEVEGEWGVMRSYRKVEPEPVIKVITSIREKVVVEEVPIYPQHFETLEALEKWVDANNLPKVLLPDEDGYVRFNNREFDSRYDCDDYSEDYQDLALRSGLILTEVPVTNGRIWGVKVSDVKENHIGNWTKINGVYYYVETSPGENRYRIIRIMSAD